MFFVRVFDDQHLKHARQTQERRTGQEDQAEPATTGLFPCRNRRGINQRDGVFQTTRDPPDDENPDGNKRNQLDHRLNRNRDHNAMVAFVRIKVPRAENNGERRQSNGHPKRRTCEVFAAPNAVIQFGKYSQGQGHRLQLQRQIRRGRRHHNQRHQHAQRGRFAEPRRHKVSDRRDFLAPADTHQFAQYPPPPDHDNRWPQIDRQILKP